MVALGACRPPVESSAVVTGPAAEEHGGSVVVRASDVPPGARQVGVVEAHGMTTIDRLVPELASRAAKLGANFVKVDDISTKFEILTHPESYQYRCGTQSSPRQCTGTRTQSDEVATTSVTGRAFRVGAAER